MLETIEAVAVRTLQCAYKVWGFGEGMALLGLLRAGVRLDRPQWIDAVADLVTPVLDDYVQPTDHLIPVEVLTELHHLRPGIAVDKAIAHFVEAVDTEHTHRPDLPELADVVWVDCMHTDGPGLRLAGDPAAADRVIALACHRLQDETGLFSHGYSVATGRTNGVHWGRGQGWALHGLTDRDRLLQALSAHEEGGRWRTIVDDPSAPLENSVSALVASAIPAGSPWNPLRQRALWAAVAALDTNGGLPVSSATPVGPPATYLDRALDVHPWGQGPLLLALLAEA